MIERSIPFKDDMVRAILDGVKFQTRRIMALQPGCVRPTVLNGEQARDKAGPAWKGQTLAVWPGESEFDYFDCHCPYGAPGDRLWIRESFAFGTGYDDLPPSLVPDMKSVRIAYPSDDGKPDWAGRWRRSIHMPRWASRITLEIKDVRVERLQEISHTDTWAEGIERYNTGEVGEDAERCVHAFSALWESINGKGSWAENPWVWVIEFDVMEHDQ